MWLVYVILDFLKYNTEGPTSDTVSVYHMFNPFMMNVKQTLQFCNVDMC